ncbi:MAG: hypothetical protein KIH69_003150 [Anaerolineae bacterium]|nr:hypothetical protein [Anaerolineae bacterium]
MIDKSNPQITALMAAFATGVFLTLCLSALTSLDAPMTLDTAKTTYAKIAATTCGTFFFAILTALAMADAQTHDATQ